jgi:hypothetical protein
MLVQRGRGEENGCQMCLQEDVAGGGGGLVNSGWFAFFVSFALRTACLWLDSLSWYYSESVKALEMVNSSTTRLGLPAIRIQDAP